MMTKTTNDKVWSNVVDAYESLRAALLSVDTDPYFLKSTMLDVLGQMNAVKSLLSESPAPVYEPPANNRIPADPHRSLRCRLNFTVTPTISFADNYTEDLYVIDGIVCNNKIKAIKLIRESDNLSLRDAKFAIENLPLLRNYSLLDEK